MLATRLTRAHDNSSCAAVLARPVRSTTSNSTRSTTPRQVHSHIISTMSFSLDPGTFKALDANPGGTLELFDKYVQRIKLIFELAFRKADRTPYAPSDKEKKAMLLFRGGDD